MPGESESGQLQTQLAPSVRFQAASPAWLASVRMSMWSSNLRESWIMNMFLRHAGNISPMLARLTGVALLSSTSFSRMQRSPFEMRNISHLLVGAWPALRSHSRTDHRNCDLCWLRELFM